MKRSRSGRWLAAALLIVILAAGSYARLAHLGQRDFNVDELNHLYAAKSLQAGAGPELPSGNEYRRASDFTRMVAFTTSFIQRDTTATRLPSALFGILTLLLFAAIAWSIGGPWAAVWAAILLGMYPEAITQSRLGRFYTYQLVFGLLALFAGWRSLRDAGAERRPEPEEVGRQWLWGAAALLLLLLGTRVQPTTYSIAAGFGTCVLLAAALDVGVRGWDFRRSAPLQMLVAGLVGTAVFLGLRPEFLESVRTAITFTPLWAESGTESSSLGYYYALYDDFPLLIALAPVAFLFLWMRRARLAGYLFLWFVVPVALHSFLFAWKGERFIFLAVPALFLVGALAAAAGSGALYRALGRALGPGGSPRTRDRLSSAAAVGLAAAFAVLTSPAHNTVVEAVRSSKGSWSAARTVVESIPGHESLPLGISMPLNGLYYFDHMDFVVGRGFLERASEEKGALVKHEDGVRDFYSGTTIITTPDAIRARFPEADSLLIAIHTDQWRYGNIVPELKEALRARGEELCGGACGPVALYLWIPESGSEMASRRME